MKYTRTAHKQTNARLASDVAICACCVAACLLVSEGDESDAKVDGLFGDVDDWNAHQPEDYSDAQVIQSLCDDMSAGCWRHSEALKEGEIDVML